MRVLITGSRHWHCRELAESVIARLISRYGPHLTIVHGGAAGVDTAFAEAAAEHDLTVEAHPARWADLDVPGAVVRRRRDGTEYNANAGPLRNEAMVKLGAAFCIAVHKNLKSSKGTQGCVKLALAAEIPVWLIDNDEGITRYPRKEDFS